MQENDIERKKKTFGQDLGQFEAQTLSNTIFFRIQKIYFTILVLWNGEF